MQKKSLFALLSLIFVAYAQAHPVPDIPVRTYFKQDGSCTVNVEVDPRCFAADPNGEPSLMQPILPTLSKERKSELRRLAADLVKRYVEFSFEPTGLVQPEFTFDFTGHEQSPLDDEEDVVVLTGTWNTRVPAGAVSWRIKATQATPLAVVFHNYREGLQAAKFSVLFPGEQSRPFVLSAPPEPLRHVVFGSCIESTEHPVLDLTQTLPMDLFLFMGDNIYADTTDMKVMRAKYQKLGNSLFFHTLRRQASILATWDDHDMGVNDGGADYPMKKEAEKEFWDWLNEPAGSALRKQEGVYQARVFGPEGKRTQVIMLDTRYFRSPLKRVAKEAGTAGGTAIPTDDPSTTMLGEAQWKWLEGVLREPAELRLMVSSIQFAAEACGSESWANFPHEQRRLVDLIRKTDAKGVVFLSGDRHWCEFSKFTEGAPYPLYDLTASSMTQVHARGTPTPNKNRDLPKTWHKPNVGTLDIEWEGGDASLTLKILDETGTAQIEKTLRLSQLK